MPWELEVPIESDYYIDPDYIDEDYYEGPRVWEKEEELN